MKIYKIITVLLLLSGQCLFAQKTVKLDVRSLLALAILFVASCKDKPETIDPHNRTLVNIPLTDLKNILAGDWLLKKEIDCGVVGCTETTFQSGQEDIFSFLPLDSVKLTKSNGVVLVYDKAIISKTSVMLIIN